MKSATLNLQPLSQIKGDLALVWLISGVETMFFLLRRYAGDEWRTSVISLSWDPDTLALDCSSMPELFNFPEILP